MTRPKHELTLHQRAQAEAEREAKAARTPLKGWVFLDPEQHWAKPGIAYVVRVFPEPPTKRRGVSLDPPYQVFSPAGTKLGGSSHLSRAQQMAEVLEQPLPKPEKKKLDARHRS